MFGAGGGIGIHQLMMAKWARARVIAVDIAPDKFAACRKAGARQVHAAAAHGLFTGGPEILESPVFDQLVITDTVPPFRLPSELVSRRLTVLDSSAMVAAALKSEYC